jgi:cytochrome c
MIKTVAFILTCASLVAAGSTATTGSAAKACAAAPAATAATVATAGAASAAATIPTDAEKKLTLESETYCKSTATVKPTPKMVVEKVKEACALIEKDGVKAFPKFQGDKSPFIFAGTYLVINGFDGVMLMHTMTPAMNGKNFLELKDKNGKLFFAEMIKLCKEKGEGWVDFFWPKPGAKEPSPKVNYVHKAMCDGKEVVVGCGIYDMTLKDIEAALATK